MTIVSIDQVIKMNEILQNRNLPFKIHIRDACGAQSFTIECLDKTVPEVNRNSSSLLQSKYREMYELLDEYFQSNRMSIVYTEDKMHFTVK